MRKEDEAGDNVEKVQVFADLEELSEQAAQTFAAAIEDDLSAGRDPMVILAGGTTPRGCYQKLARLLQSFPEGCRRIRWFFGDERWVGTDGKESNEGMIRDLLLAPLNIPEEHIFSWQAGTGSPIGRARQYEQILKQQFETEGKYADLLVLGMGEDGHTASLFPDGWAMRGGAPDPTQDALPMSPDLPGLTAAVYAPRAQSFRLTMTVAFLKRSRRVFFLVSGQNKRQTLSRVLKGDAQLPASWMNLDQTRFLVTRDAVDTSRV
ncbi:MAG: 6-phosphogluconolactonase [Spirochaetales bacterium]|nr:6-phosphogluconolactonase [Spirochaetales bacterium]